MRCVECRLGSSHHRMCPRHVGRTQHQGAVACRPRTQTALYHVTHLCLIARPLSLSTYVLHVPVGVKSRSCRFPPTTPHFFLEMKTNAFPGCSFLGRRQSVPALQACGSAVHVLCKGGGSIQINSRCTRDATPPASTDKESPAGNTHSAGGNRSDGNTIDSVSCS